MRIVHVMNWYVPGMGYQENFLQAEQRRLGHDVEIITSDRYPYYVGYEEHLGKLHQNRVIGVGDSEDNGVPIHRLPCLIESKMYGELLLKHLRTTLRRLKPDVVHAHGAFSPLALQSILCSRGLGCGIFVDDHIHEDNFDFHSASRIPLVEIVKVFYRLNEGRVNCFMPVTYSSEKMLKSVLGIDSSRIELLHLGADTKRFVPSSELRWAGRRNLGVEPEDIVFLSSGKFDRTKDIGVLVKAFGEFVARSPRSKLVLVGSGPGDYMRMLVDLTDDLGIRDRVSFVNFVSNSELPTFYNAADVGIWPGNHSITVVEAVATGLPVIVPRNILAYKVLSDASASLDFERGDHVSLSEAMSKLANESRLRDSMRGNALNLARDKLSWEKVAKDSISIYSRHMNLSRS
jgi:glycosyltransferase involved in cell wall biosynthesis